MEKHNITPEELKSNIVTLYGRVNAIIDYLGLEIKHIDDENDELVKK